MGHFSTDNGKVCATLFFVPCTSFPHDLRIPTSFSLAVPGLLMGRSGFVGQARFRLSNGRDRMGALRQSKHAVRDLKYCLVWISKCRRKALKQGIAE
jgi:hypothetical protein